MKAQIATLIAVVLIPRGYAAEISGPGTQLVSHARALIAGAYPEAANHQLRELSLCHVFETSMGYEFWQMKFIDVSEHEARTKWTWRGKMTRDDMTSYTVGIDGSGRKARMLESTNWVQKTTDTGKWRMDDASGRQFQKFHKEYDRWISTMLFGAGACLLLWVAKKLRMQTRSLGLWQWFGVVTLLVVAVATVLLSFKVWVIQE